jgi:hypothetical protein
MIGVWIGLDSDALDFCRLDLRADYTGYCALASPAGVEAYRVTRWTLEDWKAIISLTPVTTSAEPIYLRGNYSAKSLHLEVGGTNGEWKRGLLLYRESTMDSANQETSDKVRELEKR